MASVEKNIISKNIETVSALLNLNGQDEFIWNGFNLKSQRGLCCQSCWIGQNHNIHFGGKKMKPEYDSTIPNYINRKMKKNVENR